MRRLGLFAGFLLLLGLTTAVAASFDVQAEDITSFSTPVDISVPPPPGVTGWFLHGSSNTLPGSLLENPTGEGSVNQTRIRSGSVTVEAQTDPARYHSWGSPPAPAEGIKLSGPVVLRVYQNGGSGLVTAGLFECGPTAVPDATGCDQIGTDVLSTQELDAQGLVLVDFGSVTRTIQPGNSLRVQVVYVGPVSNNAFNVQWGYKSNRPSRLDVTLAAP